MKKIILINFILLALILKIEAQIPFYSTFKVTNAEHEEKTISIKNSSYNAISVGIYVKERFEWSYLQSKRIPGGSSITFTIGKYENYSDYGYEKENDPLFKGIKGFYSSVLNLY